MDHKVALAGAGGVAGEAILEKLPESGLRPDSLVLLDDESRSGTRLAYRDNYLTLQDQMQFDFAGCAMLLMPHHDEALEQRAIAEGCLVVGHELGTESTALFVGDRLTEPEISYAESSLRLAGAELSCLAPALLALQSLGQIEQINAVCLRSAEFHGKAGIEELAAQTVSLLNSRDINAGVFPQQMAFNLIPETVEPRFSADLAEILGGNSISITRQTVNVPLFHGFAAAVQLRFANQVSLKDCESLLLSLDNMLVKEAEVSPISDCNQSFSCVISHLEQGPDQAACISFWMIADPMRYGLANNYVNVADFLLKSFL